jgi:hypothetical protein
VLLRNVVGDREDVGFRHPDRFMVRDAQEPQKDLLDDVGDIGGVTHPASQEAAQPLPVPARQLLHECVLVVYRQCDPPNRLIPVRVRAIFGEVDTREERFIRGCIYKEWEEVDGRLNKESGKMVTGLPSLRVS